MRTVFSIIILSFSLIAIPTPYLGADINDLPSWVDELQANAAKVLHTQLEWSRMNTRDYIDGKEYPVIRLQGQGSLKKVAAPFEVMHKLFSANGWKEDWKYAADGHGSSSIAYRKGTYFCLVSIRIDSGCDDEDTEHVPSVFWFSIDCRESNMAQQQ